MKSLLNRYRSENRALKVVVKKYRLKIQEDKKVIVQLENIRKQKFSNYVKCVKFYRFIQDVYVKSLKRKEEVVYEIGFFFFRYWYFQGDLYVFDVIRKKRVYVR